MVICLEQGADLHMAQLMPLPLTVTCFSKIQTGVAFLVPAYLGSPGKKVVKRVCVCMCGQLMTSGLKRDWINSYSPKPATGDTAVRNFNAKGKMEGPLQACC